MSETTERLRELLAAATPGPWRQSELGWNEQEANVDYPLTWGSFILARTAIEDDALLIAAAVNALPELLAKAEAHDALVAAVTAVTDDIAERTIPNLPSNTSEQQRISDLFRKWTAALRAATEDPATSGGGRS